MNEKQRMLQGLIYDPGDEELLSLRKKCHRLCKDYNQTSEDDEEERVKILKELGIDLGEGVYLQGPIYFDYGRNIHIGKNSYANFNLTILDVCPVTIGENVFMGTGVSIVTPLHPLRYQQRNLYYSSKGYWTDQEYGKPITIGDNCWIASNVTIVGGVHIGEGCVIGAGSVVTKDIPSYTIVAGIPAKQIGCRNKDLRYELYDDDACFF